MFICLVWLDAADQALPELPEAALQVAPGPHRQPRREVCLHGSITNSTISYYHYYDCH